MSILDKLKEQTGNKEATVISDALSSGGRGGIKVLDISYDPKVIPSPIQLFATYGQIIDGV